MQNDAIAATNEAPTYRVGQDRAGRWLAMEAQGRGGGMFCSRDAAMHFAGRETGWRDGAVSEAGVPIAFA